MIYHSALIRSERRCFYCKESSKTTFFFDASVHESINETSYFQYLPPSFPVLVTINMKYFWLETDVNPNKLRLQHLIPVYLCWVCWKSSRWVSSRGQKPCITSSQLGHRPPSWKRRMCTQSKKKIVACHQSNADLHFPTGLLNVLGPWLVEILRENQSCVPKPALASHIHTRVLCKQKIKKKKMQKEPKE